MTTQTTANVFTTTEVADLQSIGATIHAATGCLQSATIQGQRISKSPLGYTLNGMPHTKWSSVLSVLKFWGIAA